jgi:hypothetical protein
MMNQNSILLRRRNKIIVPRGDGSLPLSYTATINKNLESLGYTLSKNVLEALAILSPDDAARFYEELVAILKEARGMRDYRPMYPNFPRQVMEATAAELYLNAVLHLQTITHFKSRHAARDLRIFFPKGNLAKVAAIDYNLTAIPQDLCEAVVKICEGVLAGRFSRLPSLGKVFIDERLKDYLVPFSQRSASHSLRTLVRGSKIAFPEKGDTIRFFLWWKEGEKGGKHTAWVDLDLSAVLYDAGWWYREHISYTNLRSAKYQACHSGDITYAPQGACEFIDIDIPSVLSYGCRYVVMSVNSFSRQKFSDLPECRAGWMMREHPNSGEIFEPKTVQDRVDVASETTICIPVILDLSERKVVWADVGLKRNPRHVNNVQGNMSQMTLIGKSITEIVKPDLYSLFRIHADARGGLVEEEGDADMVFSLEKGLTPFDLEKIASEYL